MSKLGSAAMPLPIVASIGVSLVALVVLWISPIVGLVALGAVVLAGAVLFVAGRRAAGAVVALMPIAVLFLATRLAGSLWFKAYRVPSASMLPTIDVGDRVLADRHDNSPHIGDVVIVHPPVGAEESRCGTARSDDSQAPCARATPGLSDVKFIKRVVAGPGDRVAFRHGLVIRNGRAVAERYARRCTDSQCELPTAITVPPGTWFLAGDNRGESDDSRFWGPVPTNAVTGIVKYRYWPLGKAGTL
jgi:signal peptidase I